ncbi:hypothetical protein STEG23_005492, partial [Scotinomys teguina]
FYRIFIEADVLRWNDASHVHGTENSPKDDKQRGVTGKGSERSPGVGSLNGFYIPQ